MSGTHGVFQHRTGYYYTVLEEDFCDMYKCEGVNEICRSYITSILEHETNRRFEATGSEEEIWVWMSLPEMARRMRNAYSERTIHKELQGMIEEGYIKKRRVPGKAVMEYCLNIQKIRQGLSSLPSKESCKSARYNLANLQDTTLQNCKNDLANLQDTTLQNCKNDLADLQPRMNKRENKEETKKKDREKDRPTHSSTPHSSSKISFSSSQAQKEEVTLTDEEQHVYDLACQRFFISKPSEITPTVKKQCAEIAEAGIKTLEQMKDLEKVVRQEHHLGNKPIYLGNLVRGLNAWRQIQNVPKLESVPQVLPKPENDLRALARRQKELATTKGGIHS
jgi:hypothetical protein